MAPTKRESDTLTVYKSHPPLWVPKAHKEAELEYIGFHPPVPNQDEDILSESHVKNGFVLGPAVQSEYSGVVEVLSSGDNKVTVFDDVVLHGLESLMSEVLARRAQNVPSIPPSTFKMPSRVTLNDAKREAWFADLANPDVPLFKLGKSVPHGAKGHDLLDLLYANNVAIPRAVWFLRVFGANETAGLRNKPDYNPSQYSVDWANVVTTYIKKQLAEIALPSAPRVGLNIKQTFKGVLSDSESKEKWLSRFTYCLKLLRPFYTEGLVDHRTLLVWLVNQLQSCNLAQAGFIAHLADEFVEGLAACRPLARGVVEACTSKLAEIQLLSGEGQLVTLQRLLKTLLQRICLSLPDAFVSPTLWVSHSALLLDTLNEPVGNEVLRGDPRQDGIQQILIEHSTDIKRRNEAMLFRNLPPRTLARLGSMVVDIQMLNSITHTTNLTNISFFSHASSPSASTPTAAFAESASTSSFADKLDTLLTWAVTPLQYGAHRPYVAVSLLQNWYDRIARRRMYANGSSELSLHDHLFDWLDNSDVAKAPGNLSAVAILFGKLVKYNLFEYNLYVQRLIARGQEGLSISQLPQGPDDTSGSHHRDLLRWIPLHAEDPSLVNQRKFILYGPRARETSEDIAERRMRQEFRAALPLFFGGDHDPDWALTSQIHQHCETILTAPRFELVWTITRWLIPLLRKFFSRLTGIDQERLLRTYTSAVELLHATRCYGSLLTFNLMVLPCATTVELLVAITDVFHRFAMIWTSSDSAGKITAALYSAHLVWRTKGVQARALLALMVEMDNGRYLSATERSQVTHDITAYTHALKPESDHPTPIPAALEEILLLSANPGLDAPSLLANSLWYRYRTTPDWAWTVWDNAVATFRQIPNMTTDTSGRRSIALRYAEFLLHVDKHLPSGIDDQILQWFEGSGRNEILALSSDVWEIFIIVMLHMCSHGALTATSILRGLVYPTWRAAAEVSSSDQADTLYVQISAANRLFDLLVLQDHWGDESEPANLLDIHRIHTRRQDIYREAHFALLVGSMPTLVLVEHNDFFLADLKHAIAELRLRVCQRNHFLQACYRNLDVVRRGFEDQLSEGVAETMCEPLVDAMKFILSESSEESSDVNSFLSNGVSSDLSPWRLAATAIQIQFGLRQLGRALAHDSTRQTASTSLDRMTATLFRHSMASEEACFIAEMARDVDGPVAMKFINNGFKCLAEIFDSATGGVENLLDCVDRAGEVVRIFSLISERLREEPVKLSQLDLDFVTQEKLVEIITRHLTAVEGSLGALQDRSQGDDDNELEAISRLSHISIFLARLLQLQLVFPCVWTPKFRKTAGNLPEVLFRLALHHVTPSALNVVVYSLLLDTLFYITDDLSFTAISGTGPSNAPTPSSADPFRHYPASRPISPALVPAQFREQLLSLFPPNRGTNATKDLAHGHRTHGQGRDGEGDGYTFGAPVIDRPWEWTENLGEPPEAAAGPGGGGGGKTGAGARPSGVETGQNRGPAQIRNGASLSLELFGVRPTGDGILTPPGSSATTCASVNDGGEDRDEDPRVEANIRTFADGRGSESIFTRDWRESRVLAPNLLSGSTLDRRAGGDEDRDDLGMMPVFNVSMPGVGMPGLLSGGHGSAIGGGAGGSGSGSVGGPGSRRGSPSSVRSRSIASFRGSPSGVRSSASGINVSPSGSASARRTSQKRKMDVVVEEDEESDSDIEMLEGPLPSVSMNTGSQTAKKRSL